MKYRRIDCMDGECRARSLLQKMFRNFASCFPTNGSMVHFVFSLGKRAGAEAPRSLYYPMVLAVAD